MRNKLRIINFFIRSFFLQSLWNFEQMQNVGFAFCMLPLLKMFYPDPAKRHEAMQRHLGFFNTHPYMVSIILGLTMSMEKDHASGQGVRIEEVLSVKKNMAGPLAAIGDNFFWGTWRPFVALLSVGLAVVFFDNNSFNGTWIVPLFFVSFYNLLSMGFRFWSLKISFNYREQIIRDIAGLQLQSARNTINGIGRLVVVLIIIIYFVKFAHGIADTLMLGGFFAGTLLCACVRIPANLVFYGAVALCVAIASLQ
jgi:PTS system mannose-specific IID component